LDYKLAVNAAHFSSGAGPSGQALWEWEGPGGIRASERPPLLTLLAAPRLPPELARYLQQ